MAGTTNFQVWNPSQANQESDATYLADTQRVGGAVDNTPLPATLGNKLFYQVSVGLTAFMTALANKNYNTLDTNLGTLTSVLSNVLTTADIRSNLQQISYSSSVALDVSKYLGFEITLAGALSITISGQSPGDIVVLIFNQDSSGSHTVSFPASFTDAVQPDPAPNSVSVQAFKVSASGNLRSMGPSISANGINSTPIGATAPSTGNFTSLAINGSAQLGYVLTGDGTHFVPTAAGGFTSGSNANGYWVKNPAGLITQWGHASTDGDGNYVLSLPTPFTDTNYSCNANTSAVNTHPSYSIGAKNSSNSIVTFYAWDEANDPQSTSFSWQAVGY